MFASPCREKSPCKASFLTWEPGKPVERSCARIGSGRTLATENCTAAGEPFGGYTGSLGGCRDAPLLARICRWGWEGAREQRRGWLRRGAETRAAAQQPLLSLQLSRKQVQRHVVPVAPPRSRIAPLAWRPGSSQSPSSAPPAEGFGPKATPGLTPFFWSPIWTSRASALYFCHFLSPFLSPVSFP